MEFLELNYNNNQATLINVLEKKTGDSDLPISVEHEKQFLKEKINQMSMANKMLSMKVTDLTDECRELRSSNSSSKRQKIGEEGNWKNIFENHHRSESSSGDEKLNKTNSAQATVMNKISVTYHLVEDSDTSLAVKDGHQWKKYGQKVTKDNPSPRAYFKCALAPSCPAKKKVQRSVQNRQVLEATYLGEHNHSRTSPTEVSLHHGTDLHMEVVSQMVRQYLVHQLSSLVVDPKIGAAVIESLLGKHQNQIRQM